MPRSQAPRNEWERLHGAAALQVARRKRPLSQRQRLLRGVAIAAGLLLAVLSVLAFAIAAAEIIIRWQPAGASAPGQAPSRDYVYAQYDERVFTVMAALNATGYDDENNSRGMHPVRQAVRNQLARTSLKNESRLQRHLRLAHPSQVVWWALHYSDPPALQRAVNGWWVDGAPAFIFFGLDSELRTFYKEAAIADLWRQQRPAYEAEAAKYAGQAGPAVQRMLTYLKVTNPPTDHVALLPNLLDAYWRGYGLRVGNTTYVVAGPADQPNIGLVQHEAMHPIINPLVDANQSVIDKKTADALYAQMKPLMSGGYTNWGTVLRESVIRAVEVRLNDPAQREAHIANEEKQGFLMVRALANGLAAYETSGKTFADYLPTLLETVNDNSVAK